MKKHLLLILALLAFVLPARAQSDPDMLYNFKNNSTGSIYGTNFNTSVDIDNVIANVKGVDVTDYGANAKNYVSAITEATNVAYNSKGGVYMKAGGKLTFTLKKGYKVTGYQFMGQQLNGTTATITLNGISFDGPTDTQADGTYSRLYPVPSSVTTVNSITISSNKDVYIKSVGIYIEAEASSLTVNVAPPAGSYNVGQVVMASANNTSANVQMIISKIEGDNYTEISKTTTTGYNSYTFSEAGKYQVIARAYTGNWQTTSNYFCEEYTIVGTSTPATLSVNPVSGTYSAPQTISISSSKADDDIYVILTDQNNNSLVDDTFTGSWTYILSNPGTYTLYALNNDNSEINEIYTISGDTPTPATLSVNPAGGTYHYPKTVTITSSKSDDEFSVLLKNQNVTLVDNNFTGSWTYTFPGLGTYTLYAFNSDDSEINETYIITGDPCPIEITPAGTIITTGTEIKVASSVSDATLKIMVTKDGETFVEENFFDNPYIFTPTATGTYVVTAVASATGYIDTERSATFTVTPPYIPEKAPKISFSHEDQKVFGSEDEIDVTLSLNSDVYPVPDVIYYTLDGFMAHNTLETGNPGATPAGHVLTVAVDPATLSGTVRIERSHRDALNHRAVTINAYAVNTAGSDVAAATYIFNDNAAPLPDPEPTTITATVTMANQGWTSGPYSASSKNATWTSDEIVALDNATLSFETSVTISVNSSYPKYATSGNPLGLRIYGTSNNKITVTAPNGYAIKSVKPTFTTKNNTDVFYLGDFGDETNRTAMTSGTEYTLTNSASSIMLSANAGQIGLGSVVFVLEKTDASAAPVVEIAKVAPVSIKTADATTFELVTDPTSIVAGDEIIIATYYKSTAKNNTGDFYAYLNSTASNTYGAITKWTDNPGTSLTAPANAEIFKIETTDGTDGLLLKRTVGKSSNTYGYLSASNATSSNNDLKTETDIQKSTATSGRYSYFNFEKVKNGADGEFTIKKLGTTARYVKYNNNSGNASRFAAYTTTPSTSTTDMYSNILVYRKATGGSEDPTVEAPVISLSERANTTEPVTVTIDCATADAAVKYTVKKDGTTVADNLTYDAANKPVYSAVGSYTVDATATLGTASANATQVSFEITEPEKPTVATPEITLSTQAKPSDPVTVTIDCATDGATINYTVTKDGTTVADNLTYDPASKPVFSEVGSYTVNATASKEGMNPANAAPANFTIEKLVEVVEELFFVMDQNLWDVDGAYPETVVPFVYDRENGWYDLDIASIPATGWRQTAEGWFEINGGFRGNFYVRDGKANRKGLVFGAAGTVANTTYATRAAADGNQLVEPGVEYNMYIAGEGDTHKVFTTIGDDTNSKAFSAGTIRVTHTPGNKDAAKPMTLQILANSDQTTGVDSITAEDAANDADARFFNLQGVEVPADRLAPGIYIRQAGSKATKVLVK